MAIGVDHGAARANTEETIDRRSKVKYDGRGGGGKTTTTVLHVDCLEQIQRRREHDCVHERTAWCLTTICAGEVSNAATVLGPMSGTIRARGHEKGEEGGVLWPETKAPAAMVTGGEEHNQP